MPTITHNNSYSHRLFHARFFYGPMIDQATHLMYRWAKREQMETGVRRPGLRTASAINGELAIRSGEDVTELPLPSVVVADPDILELMDDSDPNVERRREPRVALRRMIRFSDGDRFETGEIINISVTGLLIEVGTSTPDVQPLGRQMDRGRLIAGAFHPDATGLGRAVGFKGRIVRCVSGHDRERLGIEFTRMVAAHRDEVSRIIERIVRRPRRRDPTLRGWKANSG
jgi:hypothetical protein